MPAATTEVRKAPRSWSSGVEIVACCRKPRRKQLLQAAAEAGLGILALAHDNLGRLGAASVALRNFKARYPHLAGKQEIEDLEMDLHLFEYCARDAIARFNCSLGQLRPQEVDIPSVVERVLERCKQYYLDSNMAPRVRLTASFKDNGLAYVDPTALENTSLNLSANAIRAVQNVARKGRLSAGEIKWSGCGNTPDGRVVIAIADNGGGIPRKLLPKLGRPFLSTKSRPFAGLGLYSTLRCVGLMGASLSVASSTSPVGCFPAGTLFRLALPTTPEQVVEQATRNKARLTVVDYYCACSEWLKTHSL